MTEIEDGTIPTPSDDPALWSDIRTRLAIHDMVTGTVICRRPFGVFLDIGYGDNAPALLLVPEFAQARTQSIDFEDFPKMGEAVNARVIQIDWERRKIALTQNQFRSRSGIELTDGWIATLHLVLVAARMSDNQTMPRSCRPG